MRQITQVVVILLAGAIAAGAQGAWFTEDFEDISRLQMSGWLVEPGRGQVVIKRGDSWRLLKMKFNSGEYTTIRPYLRIQCGTGTVFFDNLRIDRLPIQNPRFGQAEGNRLLGWEQDDVGRTVFWAPGVGSGRGCLRITRSTSGMSRVWQDVPCRPNTDYALRVLARPQDLQGSAYAEVYGINPAGGLGRLFGGTAGVRTPRKRLGSQVLALRPRGEILTASRSITVPGERLLRIHADLNVENLPEGQLRLGVVHQISGAQLGSMSVEGGEEGWTRHAAHFLSPPEGKVALVLVAEAHRGRTCVDNISVTEPRLTINPQKIHLQPACQWLRLSPGQVPELDMPDSKLLARGRKMVTEALGRKWDQVPPQVDTTGPPIHIKISGEKVSWPATESYRLRVSLDGARIEAATERGAFLGLMTLVDLISITPDMPDGTVAIPGCEIEDWPAMPFRATYMGGLPRDEDSRLAWCHRFARLKLNAVVIEDSIWFHLDDAENRRLAQAASADFRSYGLEPIPELQSFGWAGCQLAINPNVVEGTWQQDEKVTLHGQQPAALAHPNVIRTPSTDIVLTNEQKTVTYEEARDYVVIPGQMKYIFRSDAEPFKVQRTPNSRIPDGTTVLANYDWVSRADSGNCPYCPSEPQTYKIMIPAIQNTIKYLRPKYLHIGHDEPAVLNRCSRCRKRDMTGAELIAEDLHKLNNAAHEVAPEIVLMMWADALNPYHNGTWFRGEHEEELNLVPKDIIQCVWFYGGGEPLSAGRRSFEHFQNYGFAVTGSPWYDHECCRNWGLVAGEARREHINCLGLLYTSWAGRWEALETLADVAWRAVDDG